MFIRHMLRLQETDPCGCSSALFFFSLVDQGSKLTKSSAHLELGPTLGAVFVDVSNVSL